MKKQRDTPSAFKYMACIILDVTYSKMEGVIILGELLLLCCFHYITKLVLILSCTRFLDFQIVPVKVRYSCRYSWYESSHSMCSFSFCYPCSVIYLIILSSKQYVICDKVFMLTSFNKNSLENSYSRAWTLIASAGFQL